MCRNFVAAFFSYRWRMSNKQGNTIPLFGLCAHVALIFSGLYVRLVSGLRRCCFFFGRLLLGDTCRRSEKILPTLRPRRWSFLERNTHWTHVHEVETTSCQERRVVKQRMCRDVSFFYFFYIDGTRRKSDEKRPPGRPLCKWFVDLFQTERLPSDSDGIVHFWIIFSMWRALKKRRRTILSLWPRRWSFLKRNTH